MQSESQKAKAKHCSKHCWGSCNYEGMIPARFFKNATTAMLCPLLKERMIRDLKNLENENVKR